MGPRNSSLHVSFRNNFSDKSRMFSYSAARQFIVALTFFAVFFRFFGLSTINKFLRRNTMMVASSAPHQGGLHLPAITVCRVGEFGGWKTPFAEKLFTNTFKDNCNSQENVSDVTRCVSEGTFNISQVINFALLATISEPPLLLDLSLWTSKMTLSSLGMCHTLSYSQLVDRYDALIIHLAQDAIDYKIYLYDPKFFVHKTDNYFIPHIYLENPQHKTYRLATTRSDCQFILISLPLPLPLLSGKIE